MNVPLGVSPEPPAPPSVPKPPRVASTLEEKRNAFASKIPTDDEIVDFFSSKQIISVQVSKSKKGSTKRPHTSSLPEFSSARKGSDAGLGSESTSARCPPIHTREAGGHGYSSGSVTHRDVPTRSSLRSQGSLPQTPHTVSFSLNPTVFTLPNQHGGEGSEFSFSKRPATTSSRASSLLEEQLRAATPSHSNASRLAIDFKNFGFNGEHKSTVVIPTVSELLEEVKSFGTLDKWPACSSPQLPLNKENERVQPKLLTKLMNMLNSGLKELGKSATGLSPLRLQLYQRVFGELIESFVTYRPLLYAIKREYDLHIAEYQEDKAHILQLESRMATIEEDYQSRLNALQADQGTRLEELTDEVERLRMNNEVYSKKDSGIKKELATLREENKLLLSKSEELSEAHDELTQIAREHMLLKEENRLLTRKCDEVTGERNELLKLQREATSAVQSLAKQLKARDQELSERSGAYETLKLNSMSRVEEMLRQKASMAVERRSLTPRPDWRSELREMPWLESYTGGSRNGQTAANVKNLVNEILAMRGKMDVMTMMHEQAGTSKAANEKKYFTALGTGPTVPGFLRWNGKVKNRGISKRDTEMMVHDIWDQKFRQKNEDSMADFFTEYLESRFRNNPALVAEWGYNVLHALKKNLYDADLDMFYKVLMGDLDESIYTDQKNMVERYERRLTKHSANKDGLMSKPDFLQVTKEFFQNKSTAMWEALENAVSKQFSGNFVDIKKVFAEDADFNQGEVLECIREQYIKERELFLREIEKALTTELNAPRNGAALLTPDIALRALLAADPLKPVEEAQELAAHGFSAASFDIAVSQQMSISIQTFMKHLKRGVVGRSGPRAKAATNKAKRRGSVTAKSLEPPKGAPSSLEEALGDGPGASATGAGNAIAASAGAGTTVGAGDSGIAATGVGKPAIAQSTLAGAGTDDATAKSTGEGTAAATTKLARAGSVVISSTSDQLRVPGATFAAAVLAVSATDSVPSGGPSMHNAAPTHTQGDARDASGLAGITVQAEESFADSEDSALKTAGSASGVLKSPLPPWTEATPVVAPVLGENSEEFQRT